jgi:UDP-N-acetylglucosamine 1-carboxyvinyltransferase
VIWPTPLKWWYVASTDIRGGGAMLVAGTIAEWETIITNEEMIHRGYDNIVFKMQSIGVHIHSFS